MRFKGGPVDLVQVRHELNVRYVLEGSVRKAGTDVRIAVHLADTHTDRTVWSERYDRTLDHVFEIQERVSRAIAAALRLHVTSDDDRRLSTRRMTSGFAYDVYLRTRRDIHSFDPARLERARHELERHSH